MMQENRLPKICTELDFLTENSNSSTYLFVVENLLRKILPAKFFTLYNAKPSKNEELQKYFQALFPLTHIVVSKNFPANLSYVILFKYRANAFKFCFEMLSRWLVPGKRLNVLLIYAVDFSMPEMGTELYTIFEIVLRVDSKEELDEVQRNLPIIESELILGLASSYYARRILEIKGLSNDEKTAMIQEYIAYMTMRRPGDFSYDVFSEMQHVLVMCRDDFKAARSVKHLGRIICVQYLFRRALKESVRNFPDKRRLFLKIYKTTLNVRGANKSILGLIVAVNFIREKEVFEESHLIKAIRNYVPKAQAVPNSYFFNRRGQEPVCTLYLEIEKSFGEEFCREEIDLLKKELPNDLEGRIVHLMHPIFMPRNEEEVMRNILALSQQIRFVRDIPQMFINFDEQAHSHLYFTVILVRVIKPDTLSVQELFKKSETFTEYVHDRCKVVGHLRKKYKKEAAVFRLRVPKDQFLRRDHSIDLYKARQAVVLEIVNVVGEVRDYNGGMISKQNELLSQVRELLKSTKRYNDLLLENFFYSLSPVVMRTVLEPESLKKLFLMLLEAISGAGLQGRFVDIRSESNAVYALIALENKGFEEEIKKSLVNLSIPSALLASSCVHLKDKPFLGYIYRSEDLFKQQQFCEALKDVCSI